MTLRILVKPLLICCLFGTLISSKSAHALTGSDTCAAATLSSDSLASPLTVNDTTTGQTDDIDNVYTGHTSPSCTEEPTCTGGGSLNTLPAGGSYELTGVGPDRVFRFHVDSACTLAVTMDATPDLHLLFSRGGCGDAVTDCSCIDDSALGGLTEGLSNITVSPGIDYYIVVDGINGTNGAFSMTITRTAGTCNFTNEVCGNSSTGPGEACDDGNTNDCDGCRGNCSAMETGCGDGFECGAEACDDGNTTSCDGCNGDCSVLETGCGDGVICSGEACDDDNTSNCDGCHGDCSGVETGCGDGFVCGGETCDDDNTTSGDGCSATCSAETPIVPIVDAGALSDASSGGNMSDANVSTLDASSGGASGGNTAAGGTDNSDLDASIDNGGMGGNGAGGRNVGGFGSFMGGSAGTSPTAAPADEKSSGCGCITVGSQSPVGAQWLTVFGLLTLVGLSRRRF